MNALFRSILAGLRSAMTMARADINTNQPLPPQLLAPSSKAQPLELQHTSTEPVDSQLMPQESDNDDPPELEFRILDFPESALRYAEHVGTECEKRKKLGRHEICYGPFANAAEYNLVKWAANSGQSLAAINSLLGTKYVSGGLKHTTA